MDRRTFLKGATALSVSAVVPGMAPARAGGVFYRFDLGVGDYVSVFDFKTMTLQVRSSNVSDTVCRNSISRLCDDFGEIAFQIGDLVTRDGTDVQKVIEADEGFGRITVECVKEPLGVLLEDGSRSEPWCRVGHRESNLSRRYDFAAPVIVQSSEK